MNDGSNREIGELEAFQLAEKVARISAAEAVLAHSSRTRSVWLSLIASAGAYSFAAGKGIPPELQWLLAALCAGVIGLCCELQHQSRRLEAAIVLLKHAREGN